MRVLFFIRIFELAGGGGENYGFRVFNALARRGHDVHVLGADRASPVPGVTVYQGRDRIEQVLRDAKPDLTVDWGFIHPADIHRLGNGAHESFMKYSSYAYHPLMRWYKKLRARSPKNRVIIEKQRRMLKNPEAIFLANSGFTARQAVEAGADEKAVKVLYNGVDTAFFSPEKGHDRAMGMRRKWGLLATDVAVLFVAHNLLLKNFALVSGLFRRLAPKHSSLKLVVVGKRRPRWMPPGGVYVGEQGDMALWYRAVDCLVHPTFYDSCANVVLEGMSSALPVLASDVCGANELIEDSHSGFVLPVAGEKREVLSRWLEKLSRIAGDSQFRERIGMAAREAMLKNEFGDYVTKLEGFMKQVVERKTRRNP
jgi:UDP-glucose:(heptosyl)LPS alpha-1,3-glucosyltransferase